MQILHLGCGRKQGTPAQVLAYVGLKIETPPDARIVHLDADPALQPDLACVLGRDPIDLPDNSVDVAIAWHVLEHIGRQGESTEWFQFWAEVYRVLTPGGLLYGECPYYTSVWAWSDPTHTRAMSERCFAFVSQNCYRQAHTAISPYRVRCDFQWASIGGMAQGYQVWADPNDRENTSIRFALSAVKPLQPWWED